MIDFFIGRMTVLGRGLVFQPVLVTQTCTYTGIQAPHCFSISENGQRQRYRHLIAFLFERMVRDRDTGTSLLFSVAVLSQHLPLSFSDHFLLPVVKY